MTISEKVAYLKGLAAGLELDTAQSKEGKLIAVMIELLDDIGGTLEDLELNAVALGEELSELTEELDELESVVFEEDEEGGCGCGHDHGHHHFHDIESLHEIPCPNCDEPIEITEETLDSEDLTCPHCDSRFHIHIQDDPDYVEDEDEMEELEELD